MFAPISFEIAVKSLALIAELIARNSAADSICDGSFPPFVSRVNRNSYAELLTILIKI